MAIASGVLFAIAVATVGLPLLGIAVLGAVCLAGLLGLPGRPTSLIVLYVFALFLVSSRYTLGPSALTVGTLLGGLAFAFWMMAKVLPGADVGRGFPPVVSALLGFVGLIMVTYVVSQARALSSMEAQGADRHLVELLGFVGIALLIADTVRTRRDRDLVLFAVVIAGGIVAVIGILQFMFEVDITEALRPPGFNRATEGFIYSRAGFARVAGTARHPIEFGVACAAVLPIALHLAHHGQSPRVRSLSWISAIALAVVVPMSLSRSAILALAVIAVVMIPSWPSERRLRVIVTVACLAGLLTVVAPGLLSTTGQLVSGEQGVGSLEYRSEVNHQAFVLAGERPVFGSGYGTFTSDQFILDNTYLTMLIEGGAVGAAALLLLLGVPSIAAFKTRRRSTDPATRDLAQTLLAVILAIAVAGWGLTIMSFPLVAGILFFAVGMVGALSRQVVALQT